MYQPFAFLTSESPDEDSSAIWFTYYKDMRKQGGRLKMGYGPGGPPVFEAEDVVDFVAQMIEQYDLQEGGEPWKPYLKGIIQPNGYGDGVYQPFAFLTSESPDEDSSAIWFTYYKDMRKQGGRLKMGYGPGGPPVFEAEDVVDFVAQMIERGCLEAGEVKRALESATRKPQ